MLKKMLITGAGGMVGRQAAEYFSKEYAVTALTKTELSITELENVKRICQAVKPDIIVNCAVIRNDRCSQNEQLARRVNVEGVRNLAVCCRKCGAVLVQLSTDYVFEGNTGGSYTEGTSPCPVSLYGCTKRAGELFALEENKNIFVIRTGWLYGRYGDNFVHKILRQAKSGQEIGILADQYGNPTSVKELLHMTSNLLQTEAYGIYHAVCKGRTSRLAFAEQIIRGAGLAVPVFEMVNDRKSIFDTSLSTEKLYRITSYQPIHWKKALKSYLTEVKHEGLIKYIKRGSENRNGTS